MFGRKSSSETSQSKSIGRADVSMAQVSSCTLGHYFIHADYNNPLNPKGGYEIDIFGITDGTYHVDSNEIQKPGYRMHVKITTLGGDNVPQRGLIGWGRFHENYLEASVAISADQMRDVIAEIRRRGLDGVRIAGRCDDADAIAIDMVVFYPKGSTDELLT